MHISISNMKIVNLKELVTFISSCNDESSLIALSNELADYVFNKNILAVDADKLFSLIKTQIYLLNNSRSNNEKGKRYTINPTNRPTYLHSSEGIVYISLLLINISIIAIMYTFIVIARFIR